MNVGKLLRWRRDSTLLESAAHDEKNVLRRHFYPRLAESHSCKFLSFSPSRIIYNLPALFKNILAVRRTDW